MRERLQMADAPCERDGVQYPNQYVLWGLDRDCTGWGYQRPTADQLFAALFAAEPIEWNRIVPGLTQCTHSQLHTCTLLTVACALCVLQVSGISCVS